PAGRRPMPVPGRAGRSRTSVPRPPLPQRPRLAPVLAPHRGGDEQAERRDRGEAAGPNQAEGEPAVTTRLRVVAVAQEEEPIRERADAPLRGLHQAEPQILRRVLDTEEVARDPAVGSQNHHAGGVSVLLLLLIPFVTTADPFGQPADPRLLPGQEAPALRGPGAAVQADRSALDRPGLLRCFSGV